MAPLATAPLEPKSVPKKQKKKFSKLDAPPVRDILDNPLDAVFVMDIEAKRSATHSRRVDLRNYLKGRKGTDRL